MKNSRKILQVTAALNEGGVERGTLEMAAFIAAQGGRSFVASHGGKLVPALENTGSKHFLLPLSKRWPGAILYAARQLAKIIQQYDIDLVHARSRAPAWAALLACRLTHTPLITTFHGTHKIQNRFKWFYNSVMVRGERVIAISEFIRRHIIDNYHVDAARIDVAPRGFDPHSFDPGTITEAKLAALRQSHRLAPGLPVILLPGRLTRWKGQPIFLRALAEISDIPWQALIVGGAGKKKAYEEELKQLTTQLGLDDRVVFAGSQSDMAHCYALSDMVVSSSTEPEAFGRVAVEAQAMGRPVIATAHGGALETIREGQTGLLYPPQDHHELARLLKQFLQQPKMAKTFGEAGRAWVNENYTIEKMCAAEWHAYHRLLDGMKK